MGKPAPKIPAMMMTHGTELSQTQESVQIPVIKLDIYNAAAPQKQGYHQISLPYNDSVMLRRQITQSNELQNYSINNSHLLDPEDFVMSNTSMSLHT